MNENEAPVRSSRRSMRSWPLAVVSVLALLGVVDACRHEAREAAPAVPAEPSGPPEGANAGESTTPKSTADGNEVAPIGKPEKPECAEPHDLPVSKECADWAKIHGDLARLGLEALRVYGRVDPMLFVKGDNGQLKPDPKAKVRPKQNAKAFDEALARVNGDDVARKFLELGYERSLATCQKLGCQPRPHDFIVVRRDDVPDSVEIYRWFIAKGGPLEEIWKDVFLTLYSTIPDVCPLFPRLHVDDKFTGTSMPKGMVPILLVTGGCNCSLPPLRGHLYSSGCGGPTC